MRHHWILIALPLALLSACSPMHSPMAEHGSMMGTQGCEAHRQAMAGKTPAEQRAAAEAHIRAMHGSVDDAHVDRHMKMMGQRCGPAAAAAPAR